jgi:hypothetical protein
VGSRDTLYTARIEVPDLLEQGKDNLIQCPMYRAGALVAPSSGTVAVYNAANELVLAPAVTIVASVARATVTSASLASQTRGEGWRVEWALDMPDSVSHKPRNDAALVRARLYPPVTEADLYRRVKSLDSSSASSISTSTDWQDKLDDAWVEIQNRLINQGNRPNLVMSPSAFREVQMLLCLALIFEDLSTRLNEAYEAMGRRYRDQFEAAWARLNFVYDDTADEATPSQPASRKSGGRAVWTNGR